MHKSERSQRPRAEWRDGDDVSVFALGTTLLRNRWRIARWTLAGGAIAVLLVLSRAPKYAASASFIPQGTDATRTGLASLAGQFGLSMPIGNQTLSPDFYVRLLKSRTLLQRVTQDTFVVKELGGRRIAFLDLFEIPDAPSPRRQERGERALGNIVSASVQKTTGMVDLSVVTRWPSVSLSIATRLLNGVNEFNQLTRQGQAAAERKFIEGRLAVASTDLRDAENRLQEFLSTNRQVSNSPELSFERDRLQRAVSLQQQVFTSLTQSYEEVRIREVRDTPAITVIEAPSAPALPEPRGGLIKLLLGLFLGSCVGVGLAFMSHTMAKRREEGDVDAMRFFEILRDVRAPMLDRVRSLGARIRR